MRKTLKFTRVKKFDQAIQSLDNHLILSGKSLATRRIYNRMLYGFMIQSGKLPDECGKHEIVDVILTIQKERGFESATLKNHVYALKYYLRHIVERLDLFTKIPIPNIKKYNVEILNVHEISALFEACKNPRDLLIVQLMYETGIRIKELLQLRYQDFDLVNRSLTIRDSKNGKTRTVYFGKHLSRLIRIYHHSYRSLFSHSLANRQFHPFINLSRSGVRYMLASAVKRSGIAKRVSPHLLRHAFAVHYLNFGGTIYQLQRLLGHNHLTTTFYYLQYAVLPEHKNISILDMLIEANRVEEMKLKRA